MGKHRTGHRKRIADRMHPIALIECEGATAAWLFINGGHLTVKEKPIDVVYMLCIYLGRHFVEVK